MRTRDGGVETGEGDSSETGSVTKKNNRQPISMPASPRPFGIKRSDHSHTDHD